jgi:hypothetical protein
VAVTAGNARASRPGLIPGACHATVFALSLPSSVYILAMGSAQENRQAVRLLVYDRGIARDRIFNPTPDSNVWPWNVPFAATDSVPEIVSCDTCHMTSLGVCRASQRRVVSNRPARRWTLQEHSLGLQLAPESPSSEDFRNLNAPQIKGHIKKLINISK